MFALLALAGDLGCSPGPTLVGLISDAHNENIKLGILVAILFPRRLYSHMETAYQNEKEK